MWNVPVWDAIYLDTHVSMLLGNLLPVFKSQLFYTEDESSRYYQGTQHPIPEDSTLHNQSWKPQISCNRRDKSLSVYPTYCKTHSKMSQLIHVAIIREDPQGSCLVVPVFTSVPQGWILGPLLFIIYINDLPLWINIYLKPVLNADDESVLITADTLNNLKIRSASVLNHMSKWFVVTGLSLNINKTNVIKFNFNYFQDN